MQFKTRKPIAQMVERWTTGPEIRSHVHRAASTGEPRSNGECKDCARIARSGRPRPLIRSTRHSDVENMQTIVLTACPDVIHRSRETCQRVARAVPHTSYSIFEENVFLIELRPYGQSTCDDGMAVKWSRQKPLAGGCEMRDRLILWFSKSV